MAEDVVAELDAELALIEELPYRVPIHLLAKRARDEIVALRAERDIQKLLPDKFAMNVRDEALEAAARVCDQIGLDGFASDAAAAIRALKDNRP